MPPATPHRRPTDRQGLLLTGVSGGEFGVIGRVEARNPKTGKLVWVRPTVEGHMGYKYDKDGNKKRERRFRHHRQELARRPVEDRRRGHLAGRHLQQQDRPGLLRHRQPGPWNSHLRKGDNLYSTAPPSPST
jgi:alcohol dehydrogenase (cytochrome c)